jgi:hypothetical protein
MRQEPVSEEENLGVERPGRHIGVEISEVRVFAFGFVEGFPA